MPKDWYDRSANSVDDGATTEDVERCEFNLSIIADRKPYFMRYIYPDLSKRYNTYIKNTNKKCIREFRITLDELMDKPTEDLTDEEASFLRYYYNKKPVSDNDCVMNKICRRIEDEFDRYFIKNQPDEDFDYTTLKAGVEYTRTQYNAISRLYERFKESLLNRTEMLYSGHIDADEASQYRTIATENLKTECTKTIPDKTLLCDILLDLCYKNTTSKQLCWDICGSDIVANLLRQHHNIINIPVQDDTGDIIYQGYTFKLIQKEVILA